MTREETNQAMTEVVKSVGESIIEEAENIVGNFEYGQGIEINCIIGTDFIPTVEVRRRYLTTSIINALQEVTRRKNKEQI